MPCAVLPVPGDSTPKHKGSGQNGILPTASKVTAGYGYGADGYGYDSYGYDSYGYDSYGGYVGYGYGYGGYGGHGSGRGGIVGEWHRAVHACP